MLVYVDVILSLLYLKPQSKLMTLFLYHVSRPALGSTQPPVQWVPGVLSPGVKARPGRDADHSLHLVPRSWMSRSYTSSPPKRLHGVRRDCFIKRSFSHRPLVPETRFGARGQSGWDLWWTKGRWGKFFGFKCLYHSTVALHTHISSGGWTIGPLVAAVQGRGPIRLTQTTTTTWLYQLPILTTSLMLLSKTNVCSVPQKIVVRVLGNGSSLTRQPYVGSGLPQKLLPAKVSGYCFSDFVTRVFSRVGLSAPTPNPRLSWRADVFCQGCLP
jgi:hypothetical protein